MTYDTVMYAVHAHVATITLNRPEQMNSIGVDMIHELVDAIEKIGRVFCAGADLSKREATFAIDNYESEFVATRDGARAAD
jgi:2-(1,2-epoxy-1,2-dihydrophenyl)acetyl-CoA isomerase